MIAKCVALNRTQRNTDISHLRPSRANNQEQVCSKTLISFYRDEQLFQLNPRDILVSKDLFSALFHSSFDTLVTQNIISWYFMMAKYNYKKLPVMISHSSKKFNDFYSITFNQQSRTKAHSCLLQPHDKTCWDKKKCKLEQKALTEKVLWVVFNCRWYETTYVSK